MTSLLQRLRGFGDGWSAERGISSLEDYASALSMYNPYGPDLYLGAPGSGLSQTYDGQQAEPIRNSFSDYSRKAYQDNGIVFACMLARASVFSAARFQWQRLRDGAPSDTFGSRDLSLLERPWPGGTTQDLLTRMIQDADLVGNSFITRVGTELVRLRPDWVDIIVASRRYTHLDGQIGTLGKIKVGYVYYEGGKQVCDPEDIVVLLPDEVAHWMPTPDPEANFRGMSWLTPILREVQNDGMAAHHQRKFWENGATPNMVIKHLQGASPEKVKRFNEMLAEEYGGVENAYKTLNLYPGADVTVVGKDFRQIDLRAVVGAGETRIAAAAGVPPIIAGFSEGLAAATYSNYGQARRRFADGTIHPLWQNAAGTLETITPRPAVPGGGLDFRLWYDVRDVPFLREDATEAAAIESTRASTIKTYVDGGFTPESAVAAVDAQDVRLLVHTGLVSVQLLPPGGAQPGEGEGDGEPTEPEVPEDERKARVISELLPRVATGVDKVITADEGRGVLDLVGAGLGGGYEPPEPPAPPAAPAPAAAGADKPAAAGTNSAGRMVRDSDDPDLWMPETRFNKNHGKHGHFAPTLNSVPDGGGLITTGGRSSNISNPKGHAAISAGMKKHGLTHEGIRNEIRGRIKGNSLKEGRAWYPNARKFHEGLAKKHGVDIEVITGMTAAISPRCAWPENMRLTERALDIYKDNAHLSNADLARAMGGQALPVNKEMAVAILRGAPVADTLTGLKRRSFYNNMLKPGQTDDVTVDVHAAKALINSSTTGMTKTQVESFLYGSKVTTDGGTGYTILADAYRDVAEEMGLSPDEVQAAYWTDVAGVNGMTGKK